MEYKRGRSTKIFLDLCKRNNGKLFSIDTEDCSHLFNDPNWHFIRCRDDDFKYLSNKLPDKFDLIFLDTIHEANHVKKIFFHFFKYLKVGGEFYIDDISWLPYLKDKKRNSFYCEINNEETFQKLLEIYNNNINNLDIEFSFVSSGMCRIVKKNENLEYPSKINTRQNSLKNIVRKLIRRNT